MEQPTRRTLSYYEHNCRSYIEATQNVPFAQIRKLFTDHLCKGATVLDFGCGSGRDSLAFLQEGFKVEALDGSLQMCNETEKLTGIKTRNLTFDQFHDIARYNGIWACASLLHVPYSELDETFLRLHTALKENGILYASFKEGSEEETRDGRLFTDLNIDRLNALPSFTAGFVLLETKATHAVDSRHKQTTWFNFIAKKK
ncbi:MAG: class I SAM-dependent methyltransferase [Spirochaetia bacterium]|jgi:cyclopropane fatty-acyl-phospholipid synthase-like methyltransferase|nr:class I SAM-dependent methyltransferase [Spirochaetia bacterium]